MLSIILIHIQWFLLLRPENTHIGGSMTVQLVSSLARHNLPKKRFCYFLLFVSSEAVESKLVKLEARYTVILPTNGECSLFRPPKRYLRGWRWRDWDDDRNFDPRGRGTFADVDAAVEAAEATAGTIQITDT